MELPKIISVDDHVVEPAHVWQTWLPEKYREKGPRIERKRWGTFEHKAGARVREPRGPERAVGRRAGTSRTGSSTCTSGSSRSRSRRTPDGDVSRVRPHEDGDGSASPTTRCAPAATTATRASTTWSSTGSTARCRSRRSRASAARPSTRPTTRSSASRASRRTTTGWSRSGARRRAATTSRSASCRCGTSSSRREEIQRNAERGVRAFCFSELPHHLKLPTIHSGDWDPVFQVCNDTGVTLCMHIGSSSTNPAASPDAPGGVGGTLAFNNSMASLADWLFSGKLIQFPKLKLAYSEGQIGWIPYALERADTVWEQHDSWQHSKERHPRAAVDLLLRPHLRVLHRRPPRPALARRGRRGQHLLRDRLPAHRHDVAELEGVRREDARRTSTRTSRTRCCAATRSRCWSSTGSNNRFRRQSARHRRANCRKNLVFGAQRTHRVGSHTVGMTISRRSLLLGAAATAGLFVAGCSTKPSQPGGGSTTTTTAPLPPPYFPSGTWEAIDSGAAGWDAARLEVMLVFAGEQTSKSVVLLLDGRILAERYYGVAPDFRREIASCQKSVVSVLVGQAEAQELVSLDAPVASYLGSGWSNADASAEAQITIRHLLSMTSGLDAELRAVANRARCGRTTTTPTTSSSRCSSVSQEPRSIRCRGNGCGI